MTVAVDTAMEALSRRLVQIGRDAGLDEVAICGAEPFESTRQVLEERRDKGYAAGMQFTYRNPQRSTHPERSLEGATSLVVAALRYDQAPPPRPDAPSGRVARYATKDHYARLRHGLEAIATALVEGGHRSRVLADDNALVDRAAAVRAGIGWYGKSANVLVPRRGSWFVLGSVLTDALLSVTGEPVADGCGGCTRCLEGCPTGAIVAPGVVDGARCLAWLLQASGDFPLEFRAALGDRLYGCDECQEVCPPSVRIDRRADPAAPPVAGEPGSWVSLSWILDADDDELLGRLGRWYVPQRDPRYLRRNALVASGNVLAEQDVGAQARADLLTALRRHSEGQDPMLAEHARWAIGRAAEHG